MTTIEERAQNWAQLIADRMSNGCDNCNLGWPKECTGENGCATWGQQTLDNAKTFAQALRDLREDCAKVLDRRAELHSKKAWSYIVKSKEWQVHMEQAETCEAGAREIRALGEGGGEEVSTSRKGSSP